MDKSKITCVGEGMIVLVPERPGALEDVPQFSRGVGGAELNVAITLANLGVTSAWLSRVGDDGFGRHIVAAAAARGVDVSAVETDPAHPTGLYVKEVGGTSGAPHDLGPGNSRMHYYRTGSAASCLSRSYLSLEATQSVLASSSIVHITGITPALSPDAESMSLSLSDGTDYLLSVDANWRPALWAGRLAHGASVVRELMSGADIVFLGASEASALLDTTDPAEIRAALPAPRWLIIKNDGNAAIGFDGQTRCDVPANAIAVVEQIGAGDAFAAGVLAGLSRREPLEESIRTGHAAAAKALQTAGDHA